MPGLTDAEEGAVGARVIGFIDTNKALLTEKAKAKGTSVPDVTKLEEKNKAFFTTVQNVKNAKVAWDKAEDVKSEAKDAFHQLVSDYINILEGIVGKTTQEGKSLADIRSKLRGTRRDDGGDKGTGK